jgi:hypothetical protein
MKQLLLITLSLFIITTANAQIGKGHKYIGGSLNVNYDENGYSSTVAYPTGTTYYTNNKILNLQVIPEMGWFLSDKWSLGLRPSYSRVSGTESSYYYDVDPTKNNTTVSKYHTDVVGLGVNLRYYRMLTNKVALVPQFGISTANNVQSFGNGTLVAGVNPYLIFFPTEKLGLNFGFGNLAYYFDYKTRGSSVNLGLNNNFTFGLNYYW